MQTFEEIITELKRLSDGTRIEGMKKFGINVGTALGVSIPALRRLARKIKQNHSLALLLWQTNIHEARILASMIDDAKQVTETQIDEWVEDFNSWDVCDQVCGNLFDKTPFTISKAKEFSAHENEFVKRAGFVLMAEFAVHNKRADNKIFLDFFPIIVREANDERNFVKKAVNWALRQIGKRNKFLHEAAIKTAKQILQQGNKSSKWVAKNALRELKYYTF